MAVHAYRFPTSLTTLRRACWRQFQSSSSPLKQQAWKIGKVNHVAIACNDLDKATALYRDVLQANVSKPLDLPEHGVTVVFVKLGETEMEVSNIKAAVEEIMSKKVRILGDGPQIGAHGKSVVFLHPKDCNGVLLELEEGSV